MTMSITLKRREFLQTATVAALASSLAERTALAQADSEFKTTPYPAPSGERALKIANLNDLEQEASKVIPPGAFAYISAGSDNQ
jgi:hypothetical protein